MKPRPLSTPLRLILTALFALTTASLLSHVTLEPFWPWLADIILGLGLARFFWRQQLATWEYEAECKAERRRPCGQVPAEEKRLAK